MKVSGIEFEDLSRSVIAVPPLAQTADLAPDRAANQALIEHLAAGGVGTLMYGGNANFYNIPLSAYAHTLEMLIDLAPADTWIIPAVGPDFGRMSDQADALRDFDFPTAMALPHYPDSGSRAGVMTALRRLHDRLGRPLMVYVKHARGLAADDIAQLVEDGVAGWIKYALVVPDAVEDPYLERLVERLDPRTIISGIGERPVISHFRHFGLSSFTSGSVSIAPALSTAILRALEAGDDEAATGLRSLFIPFEDCRDAMGPARVVHDGVSLSGIADMGPIAPLQSNLDEAEKARTSPAARALLAQEMTHRGVRQ